MRRIVGRRLCSFLLSLVWLGACAGSGTDPGTGSKTILTIAVIEGRLDSTTIEVDVSIQAIPVRGANVVVTDLDTDTDTTLESEMPGLYKTVLRGYARTVRLRVTSGDDVMEATLEGPPPHHITRPPEDSIVRRAGFSALKVEWDGESAERAEVSIDGQPPLDVKPDVGEAEVPIDALSEGDHSIRVLRENQLVSAGGAQNSLLRLRYKVDNRFTLEG